MQVLVWTGQSHSDAGAACARGLAVRGLGGRLAATEATYGGALSYKKILCKLVRLLSAIVLLSWPVHRLAESASQLVAVQLQARHGLLGARERALALLKTYMLPCVRLRSSTLRPACVERLQTRAAPARAAASAGSLDVVQSVHNDAALASEFLGIDEVVQGNMQRVQQALCCGTGPSRGDHDTDADDWSSLDNAVASIMGAEAAMIRFALLSGEPSSATCKRLLLLLR